MVSLIIPQESLLVIMDSRQNNHFLLLQTWPKHEPKATSCVSVITTYFSPWASALVVQGGRGPTLEIIWVEIAYREFPFLEIVE